MAGTTATSSQAAQHRVETLARSIFQLRGYPAPGGDALSSIVNSALGGMSDVERSKPENISSNVIGQIAQLVERSVEAGRPLNMHSAEAARAAQQQAGGAPSSWASLGGNDRPFDQFQRLAAMRDRDSSRDGNGVSGNAARTNSGARYDDIVSDWNSARGLAVSRTYAASNDMGWAMKDADLMRMGKPALKALNEAGLKGDGYQALRSPKSLGFDNPTIVKGAEYMKRNGANYNEAAKASAEVDKGLKGEDKQEHKHLVKELYGTEGKPAKGVDRAKQKFRDAAPGWKERNPEMAPKIDNELKELKIQQGQRNENRQKAQFRAASLASSSDATSHASQSDAGRPTSAIKAASKSRALDALNS